MPRAESKHLGTQFYHSPPLSPASQHQSPQSSSASSGPAAKKKHVCGTCDRTFTTSGHLVRHSRVHTGERNHKCPFPGCETHCSRQDNLQQHYRIHLSSGSRWSSTHSSASRGTNGKKASNAAISQEPLSAPPSLSSPPPLEPARFYSHHSSLPDSPPPLVQVTLPATATLPLPNSRMDAASDRSSSSASLEASYSSNHHIVLMSSQGMALSNNQNYSYRSSASTYQELSQGAGFTSHNNFDNGNNHKHPMHHHQNRGNSPVSISSRHSISHILHPQSTYSQNQPSSAGPASPASSQSMSSHTSGPPTPTYPVSHDEAHQYNYHSSRMIAHHSGMGSAHMGSQSHLIHNGYANMQGRGNFKSPPILAPIQDARLIRRDDCHSQSHNTSPYIHHPQPLLADYPYHQSLGLGHGAWKGESGMRKGVGTALV
ncbi:hypothetical protein BDZ97DRAFT_1844789 [Flammula alnicola]|nr:hypothetical protein BDZ97DRAFT_1844789 [Flammula alnicola]